MCAIGPVRKDPCGWSLTIFLFDGPFFPFLVPFLDPQPSDRLCPLFPPSLFSLISPFNTLTYLLPDNSFFSPVSSLLLQFPGPKTWNQAAKNVSGERLHPPHQPPPPPPQVFLFASASVWPSQKGDVRFARIPKFLALSLLLEDSKNFAAPFFTV